MKKSKILIVLGSDSDYPIMEACFSTLRRFGIEFVAKVCSAHRSPGMAADISSHARENGYSVIIAAAGLAAHLPGVLAAYTTLPVIGVPCSGGALSGVDALYSIVQMPSGVPVASVAIDGAVNAAILAAQILSLSDNNLENRLMEYKKELEKTVVQRNERLAEKITLFGEKQ